MNLEDTAYLDKLRILYNMSKQYEKWVEDNLTDEERYRHDLKKPLMLTLTTVVIDIKHILFKYWKEEVK